MSQGCVGFPGQPECEREVIGEIFDTKKGVVLWRYCFLHRPAVRDGRYTTKVARRVT